MLGSSAVLPQPLKVLSWMSIGVGVTGMIATAVLYATYKPQPGDEGVVINVAATGGMMALYFAMFAVFGAMIVKGKTWGLSGLILTHLILLIITYTIVQSGQYLLAGATGLFAAVCLFLACNPQSMAWYQQRYAGR